MYPRYDRERNPGVNVVVNLNVNLNFCQTLVTNMTYAHNIWVKCTCPRPLAGEGIKNKDLWQAGA